MSSRNVRLLSFLTLGLAAAATGCLPALVLTPQQAVASKPSNVVIFFEADTNTGKAVTDLRPDGFSIFENGTRVTNAEGRQTLLRPAASHYTLFLVDMSGRTLGAKEAGEVIKAATALSAEGDKSENLVAVYSFDGSPELEAVVPFATSGPLSNGAADHATPHPHSGPPSGIETAVVLGLRTLNLALAADPKVLKAGTLVLFTDETNHADRMRINDLRSALGTPDNKKIDMIAVGIGTGVDEARLDDLGRNAVLLEPDPANMPHAFAAAEAAVVAESRHYYLLSYCTPARAGMQEVRIETHAPDGLMGELTYSFSADGFGPGCDPTSPPVVNASIVAAAPSLVPVRPVEKPSKESSSRHGHKPHAAPPAPTPPPPPAAGPEAAAEPPPPPKPAPAPPKPAPHPAPPPPAADPFAP
jgi:hypothetical protein